MKYLKNMHRIFHIRHSSDGFTLIEAVVSAAVFALVMSSVIGVYLAVANIDAKTRAERGVQQNARFIMDFLGKEIRNGGINYAAYPSSTVPYTAGGYATELRVINQSNEAETITCSGTNLTLTKTSGTTNLNSPGVSVSRCAFYISPSTSPFRSLASNPPDQQPFVTMVLQLSSAYGNRTVDYTLINLESTFATREYPARE